MSDLSRESLKDDLVWRKSQELQTVTQKIEELDALHCGKSGSKVTLFAYIFQFGALSYFLVAILVSAYELSLVTGALLFLLFAALSVAISRWSVRRQETSEMPEWEREEYERHTQKRRELEQEISALRERREEDRLKLEAQQIAAHAGRISIHEEGEEGGKLELVDDDSLTS